MDLVGGPGQQSAPAGPGSRPRPGSPARLPPGLAPAARAPPASPVAVATREPPGARRGACWSSWQRRRQRQLRLQLSALRPCSGDRSSPPARLRAPSVVPDPAPEPGWLPAPMELLAAAFSAACAVDHDSSTSESDARDSAAGHLPGR